MVVIKTNLYKNIRKMRRSAAMLGNFAIIAFVFFHIVVWYGNFPRVARVLELFSHHYEHLVALLLSLAFYLWLDCLS
jgi:hypothetical protein